MPKRKHAGTSQARIYEAALLEFAEFGLAGARVDRIAGRAGINKAMIYYHFGSKQELYDTVVKNIAEDASARIGGAMKRAAKLEDALLAIAGYHSRGLAWGSQISRILLHEVASGGETLRRIIPGLAAKMELRSIITDMIEAGKREGRYRDVDTRHAMISFVGMSIFYLIMAPMVNEVWGISDKAGFRDERPEAIVDLFMNGLNTR
jgi:TetR/AcrR family transcriptional regulator